MNIVHCDVLPGEGLKSCDIQEKKKIEEIGSLNSVICHNATLQLNKFIIKKL